MLVYQAGKGKPMTIHITSYWYVLIAGEVAQYGDDCFQFALALCF